MKKTKVTISLFFFTMAFISGVFIYSKLSSRQTTVVQDEVSLFLKNVMIRENGIYTLLGSKPITTFRINNDYFPQSKEEITCEYKRLIDSNPSFEDKLSFADYEASIHQAKAMKHLKYEELWNTWKNTFKNKGSKKYLFTSRRSPYSGYSEGFFINIPMTMYTLSVHQELFQQHTNIIFDPKQVIWEITSEHSEFWEKVFSDHVLVGILLGFGERNAFLWELENQSDKTLRCKAKNSMISDSEYSSVLVKESITISDLLIPTFISYSIYDSQVERYQKERELILQEFNEENFTEKVIDVLSSM